MDDNVASGFIAYCRKNYKWYNECKCDKRTNYSGIQEEDLRKALKAIENRMEP